MSITGTEQSKKANLTRQQLSRAVWCFAELAESYLRRCETPGEPTFVDRQCETKLAAVIKTLDSAQARLLEERERAASVAPYAVPIRAVRAARAAFAL